MFLKRWLFDSHFKGWFSGLPNSANHTIPQVEILNMPSLQLKKFLKGTMPNKTDKTDAAAANSDSADDRSGSEPESSDLEGDAGDDDDEHGEGDVALPEQDGGGTIVGDDLTELLELLEKEEAEFGKVVSDFSAEAYLVKSLVNSSFGFSPDGDGVDDDLADNEECEDEVFDQEAGTLAARRVAESVYKDARHFSRSLALTCSLHLFVEFVHWW